MWQVDGIKCWEVPSIFLLVLMNMVSRYGTVNYSILTATVVPYVVAGWIPLGHFSGVERYTVCHPYFFKICLLFVCLSLMIFLMSLVVSSMSVLLVFRSSCFSYFIICIWSELWSFTSFTFKQVLCWFFLSAYTTVIFLMSKVRVYFCHVRTSHREVVSSKKLRC